MTVKQAAAIASSEAETRASPAARSAADTMPVAITMAKLPG